MGRMHMLPQAIIQWSAGVVVVVLLCSYCHQLRLPGFNPSLSECFLFCPNTDQLHPGLLGSKYYPTHRPNASPFAN
jgi:hypothetical protein